MMEEMWEREVVSVAHYLMECTDDQVKGAMRLQTHLENMGQYSYIAEAKTILGMHGIDESGLGDRYVI